MSQPPAYTRQANFTTFEGINPTSPKSGVSLDAEFAAIKTTLDAILVNLALIQRDDGALKNASVHVDALSSGVLGLFNAGESNVTGAWLTATAYAAGDVVTETDIPYICVTAHTSGAFATDLAADKWVTLAGPTGAAGAAGSNGSNGTNGTNGTNGSNGIFSAIANQAEAEAGADTTKGMTAERVAQAIAFQTIKQGVHALWIPAPGMTPRSTNGAAAGTSEVGAHDLMFPTLDYDASTSEGACVLVKMPKSWNEGTLTAKFVWMHGSTVTNFGVRWGVRAAALSDGETPDQYGTEQEVTDTGGATNNVYVSGATGALTVGGTPSAEDLVVFEIYRDPADGADNMAVDAKLIGVELKLTIAAADDS